MKKIIVLISIFAFMSSFMFIQKAPAISAREPQYARIKSSGIYLYSSPTVLSDSSNKLFELQSSYFVELLEYAGESFYKARYMEITGYVKQTEVTCVSGTPATPFASNLSFRVFALDGINLRSSSDNSNPFNIVDKIPFLSTSLIFYGTTSGTEAISLKGTTWYYCKYVGGTTPVFGYVYSVFCDLLPTIPQNTEIMQEISTPNFTDTTTPINKDGGLNSFPVAAQIAIIVGVSLPCLVILYLLFKPTKLVMKSEGSSAPPKKKPKIKRAHSVDYYEFDEMDL